MKENEMVFPEFNSNDDKLADPIWVGKFNGEESKKFCESVIKANKEHPDQPILVYINSYGGEVDALAAMMSVMDSVPNQFITVCVGTGMSCGACLLAHGDIRFITPHSRVMIHEVSGFAMGNIADVKNDAKELDRLNQYFMNLLARDCGKRSGKDLNFTNERREIYMTAQEALEFGIVDKIGTPELHKSSYFKIKVI